MAAGLLACAWASPAFPADAPAPGVPIAPATQGSDDASLDSQPPDAAMLPDMGETAPATPAADASAAPASSSLRLAPIAIRVGGNLGYDIQQRNSKGGNSRLSQRLVLNLRGKANSYISRPWIAKVNGELGLTSSKNKFDDIGSSSNLLAGIAGVDLVPYSRYPFQARLSRNQTYSGPGIDAPVSQNTRLDMNQAYTPWHKLDSYHAIYYYDIAESQNSKNRQTGFDLSGETRRFKNQPISSEISRDAEIRDNGGNNRQTRVKLQHSYSPGAGMSLDNNASMASSYDYEILTASSSRIRELNSTLTWQPNPSSPLTMIGSARVNAVDLGVDARSSHSGTYNAYASANYRHSQYLNMSASGNVNVLETDTARIKKASTTENIAASYPLASSKLGDYAYGSSIGGGLSNITDATGSRQTLSLSPNHFLNRGMDWGGGKLTQSFSQGWNLSDSTDSKASSRISHAGSLSWSRTRDKSTTNWTLNGRDSRSLSKTQDSVQNFDFTGSVNEEISRYSTLRGQLAIQSSRQLRTETPSTLVYTNSNASLQYGHQQAFGIPRLIFSSGLHAHSRAALPVAVGTPQEQGPISWESTLSYTVGRLVTNFWLSMSKESNGSTQSLIALSLKRYF